MRIRVAVFLSLVIVFCFWIIASASEIAELTITSDKTVYTVGETATVHIVTNDVKDLYGINFTIEFDENYMELSNIDSEYFDDGGFIYKNSEPGVIQYVGSRLGDVAGVVGKTDIMTLTFTIKKAGPSAILINRINAADSQAKLIGFNKGGSLVFNYVEPTPVPTPRPRPTPRPKPTAEPTSQPTAEPTEEPTAEPTVEPTEEPTESPTGQPSDEPTDSPTEVPTGEPTDIPSDNPMESSGDEPTAFPSESETPEGTIPDTGNYENILFYIIAFILSALLLTIAWTKRKSRSFRKTVGMLVALLMIFSATAIFNITNAVENTNGDNTSEIIEIDDLVLVAKGYGLTNKDDKFDAKLDVNNDGIIDNKDVTYMAEKLMENYNNEKYVEAFVLVDEEPAELLFNPIENGTVKARNHIDSKCENVINYIEGKDYIIDYENGTIRRTANSTLKNFSTHPAYKDETFVYQWEENAAYTIYVEYEIEGDGQLVEAPDLGYDPLSKVKSKLENGEDIKYVVYGDSISDGGNATDTDHAYYGRFANMLRGMYPQGSVELIKSAKGGEWTTGGVNRLKENVIDLDPDIVTIGYGMNDHIFKDDEYVDLLVPPEKYEANMRIMIEEIQENTDADIILVSSCEPNPRWVKASGRMNEYSEILKKLAAEYKIGFADVYTLWRQMIEAGKRPESMLDGVNHPSDYGHFLYYKVFESLFIQK